MDGSWTFHYGPSGFLPIEGLPSRFQQAHRPCFDAFSIFRFGTHTSRSPPSCASLVCISSSACLRFMLSPTPMVGRLYSTSLSTLRKHAPLFVSLCTHPLLSWFLCLLFTRSVHLSPSLVCVAIVLVLAPPNFCVLGWLACHRVDCRWHMDFFLGGVNTWWCTTMGQTNQTRNKSTVVLRHGATTAATAAFLRRRCGQDRERRRRGKGNGSGEGRPDAVGTCGVRGCSSWKKKLGASESTCLSCGWKRRDERTASTRGTDARHARTLA